LFGGTLVAQYHRVLVKLSGEALGLDGKLFDHVMIERVAHTIAEAAQSGTQIALVVGAGNIWRGRQGPSANMDAVLADHMGMLGTLINSIAMQDALISQGVAATVMSAVPVGRFAVDYNPIEARRRLDAGEVLLFACGIGNPLFSTDTAAAMRAIEIKADALLLAKNVDGVYDDDPRKNPSARLIRDITYREAERRALKVMDTAALVLCRENNMPLTRVFALSEPDNILRVLEGNDAGTFVHP
jgi:uridylate kinase